MKICLIGCRGHYNLVTKALKDHPELKIVAAAPGTEGDDMNEVIGYLNDVQGLKPESYTCHEKMLDEVRPDIAVVNCQFGDHGRVSKAVLERGIHLFCEKPLATSLDVLDEMEALSKEKKLQVWSMTSMRYDAHFHTACRLVHDGAIGRILMMNGQKSYRLGTRPEFYYKRSSYGGTIPWVGAHALDWFLWFSKQKIIDVTARHTNLENRGHGEMESMAVCQMNLESGILATANLDFLNPKTATVHGDDRLRVVGTDGVVEVRYKKVYLINADADGIQEIDMDCPYQIFLDFCDNLKGEGSSTLSTEEAFATTRACLIARESADQQKTLVF